MASGVSVGGSEFELSAADEVLEESFIQQQMARGRMVQDMIHHLGFMNTCRVVYGRLAGAEERNDVITVNQPHLSFPVRMTINPIDLYNYEEVIKDRAYELPDGLHDDMNGRQIVDLGGFIGLAATFLASRYADSPVLSVEPHPRNYALLEANAEPYEGRIQTRFAAVSPVPGVALATHHGSHTQDYMGNNFSVDTDDGFSNLVPLDRLPPAITPEDIVAQTGGDTIGILKVDIEGAERALFRSEGIHELLSRTAVLMVETHDRLMPGCDEAVRSAVARHGFSEEESLSCHTTTFVQAGLA